MSNTPGAFDKFKDPKRLFQDPKFLQLLATIGTGVIGGPHAGAGLGQGFHQANLIEANEERERKERELRERQANEKRVFEAAKLAQQGLQNVESRRQAKERLRQAQIRIDQEEKRAILEGKKFKLAQDKSLTDLRIDSLRQVMEIRKTGGIPDEQLLINAGYKKGSKPGTLEVEIPPQLKGITQRDVLPADEGQAKRLEWLWTLAKEVQRNEAISSDRKQLREEKKQEEQATVEWVASGIMAGRTSPILPRGRLGFKVKEILEKNKFNQAAAERDYKATLRAVGSANSPKFITLRTAFEAVKTSVTQIRNFFHEWHSSGLATKYKVFNRAALAAAAQNEEGRAGVIAETLKSAIPDMVQELAQVYAQGNAPTDLRLEEAAKSLKAEWGPKTVERNLELIWQNLITRQRSFNYITSTPAGVSPNNLYATPFVEPTQQTMPGLGQVHTITGPQQVEIPGVTPAPASDEIPEYEFGPDGQLRLKGTQ